MNDTIKADLLENAPVIIAFHDREHNLLWANAAYRKATGFSLQEIIGKKCYSVWGLSRPCCDCPVTSAIDTGEPAEAELTPRNQDHWPETQGSWLATAAPIRNKDGEITGAIEVAYNITESKKSEDKLRISEEKYRMVVENAAEGILLLDAKGKILEINNRTLQISGLKREEVMGRYFWKLLPAIKMNITDVIGAFKDLVLGKRVGLREWSLINKSGTKVVIQAHASLVKENGTIQGISVILEDITERKETETRLRRYSLELEDMVKARTAELTEANQQLRREIREREETGEKLRQVSDEQKALLSTIPAFVYLKDRGGRYIAANRVFAEMTGTTVDEIPGKTDFDLFPEEHARQYRKDDQKVMESGKVQSDIEEEVISASGKVIWASTSKTPLLDTAGRVVGLVGITLDITGRKLAEQALRESEERFRMTFESSGIGKVLAELDGSFFRVNDAMCSMMGFAEEEMLSLTINEITYPDDLSESNDSVKKLLQGNLENDKFVLEKRFLHKNRDIILGRVHVCLIRNQQGEPIHMMAEIEDINERKRNEDALQERMKELEIFYEAAVDRELRMEELRKEIEELKKARDRKTE